MASNMKGGTQAEIEAASIWRTGAYAGEFGDPFIADTDLEGGHIAPSLHTYCSIVRSELLGEDDLASEDCDEEGLLAPLDASLSLWSATDKNSIIKKVVQYVAVAAEIEAELSAVSGDPDKFSAFLQKFRRRLLDLKPGERLLFGGGWHSPGGGHAIMHVVERDLTDGPSGPKYAFVVCNTGDGVNYHPVTEKGKTRAGIGGNAVTA